MPPKLRDGAGATHTSPCAGEAHRNYATLVCVVLVCVSACCSVFPLPHRIDALTISTSVSQRIPRQTLHPAQLYAQVVRVRVECVPARDAPAKHSSSSRSSRSAGLAPWAARARVARWGPRAQCLRTLTHDPAENMTLQVDAHHAATSRIISRTTGCEWKAPPSLARYLSWPRARGLHAMLLSGPRGARSGLLSTHCSCIHSPRQSGILYK